MRTPSEPVDASTPDARPPQVQDRRTRPPGIVSPHIQTFAMLLIAGLILGAVYLSPRPPTKSLRSTATSITQTTPPSLAAELRARLDTQERALADARRQLAEREAALTRDRDATSQSSGVTPSDPDAAFKAERRRRDEQSLFADQVVYSRGTARTSTRQADGGTPPETTMGLDPALLAAYTLALQQVRGSSTAPPVPDAPAMSTGDTAKTPPEHSVTAPLPTKGSRHRVLRGTILEATLNTALEGEFAGPVQALVATPIYNQGGQILIPAGARLDGQARPVNAMDQERLAVTFDRLTWPEPDGRVVALAQTPGLSQSGATGLRDQVDRHYLSVFGAATAVGLLSGLSNAIGSAGDDVTVRIGTSTEQASTRLLEPFLNRRPTHRVSPGHRLRVLLTQDLDLPVYEADTGPPQPTRLTPLP